MTLTALLPVAPPRYADHARVSTEQQAAKELSISAQQREICVYAGAQKHENGTGWICAESFADAGISGTTMDRPGLQALLAAAHARLFDILLVHKMDRLSREEIEYAPILDELHVASYSGGLDDDDMGEVADIILIKARRRAERQGRA